MSDGTAIWRRTAVFLAAALLLAIAAACDPSDDQPPPTSSGATGYPAAGYPGPETAGGYPLAPEPANDPVVVPPNEELPKFPGKMAFHSERTGALQLFTIDGATSEVTPFLSTAGQAFEPSWAPDCQSLAFSSGGEDFNLFTAARNGQPQPVVGTPELLEWAPAWSPAGDVIAYQNNQDTYINICFTTPQGAGLGCMERETFSNAMPAWSPDGARLVFGSNRDGDWDLYLSDYPPTGALTRVTDNQVTDFYPAFSPDGSRLVYASQSLGTYDIFTVSAEGGEAAKITTDNLDDTTPIWVGNDVIAFSSNRSEDWELYLINADGSNESRLTYSRGLDQWPAWCASP